MKNQTLTTDEPDLTVMELKDLDWNQAGSGPSSRTSPLPVRTFLPPKRAESAGATRETRPHRTLQRTRPTADPDLDPLWLTMPPQTSAMTADAGRADRLLHCCCAERQDGRGGGANLSPAPTPSTDRLIGPPTAKRH